MNRKQIYLILGFGGLPLVICSTPLLALSLYNLLVDGLIALGNACFFLFLFSTSFWYTLSCFHKYFTNAKLPFAYLCGELSLITYIIYIFVIHAIVPMFLSIYIVVYAIFSLTVRFLNSSFSKLNQ